MMNGRESDNRGKNPARAYLIRGGFSPKKRPERKARRGFPGVFEVKFTALIIFGLGFKAG
jgi:hypothetical protein